MQQRGDRIDQGEGHELSCMSAYQLHMYERERVRKMVLPLLSDTCGHSSDTTGHRRTFGHTRTSNVGHTGHMSSDTSDTSDICPRTHLRTLPGHCSDTVGHTGHIGQPGLRSLPHHRHERDQSRCQARRAHAALDWLKSMAHRENRAVL